MDFRTNLTLFFIFSLLLSTSDLQAQQSITAQNDSLIQKAIELSIRHDYKLAEEIFQKIIDDYPEHPEGYFFMAATIQSKMMDFETDKWDQDFFHYINLAIKTANEKINESPQADYWAQFYKGSALCYLAFFEGRKEKYLPAIRHSFKGISILKEIAKIDPQFYDVFFGIGSYNYWRSRVTRFVNWLPLISDDRENGIRMVKQAIKKGRFTRYAALNELVWILLDAGKPEQAFNYAQTGLEKFPQSRFFLWGAAKSAYAMKNYNAAINYFQKILDSIIKSTPNNHYNEYICRVKLAECYLEIADLAEAKNQIGILKSLKLAPEIKKRLKKQRKLLIKFEKMLNS